MSASAKPSEPFVRVNDLRVEFTVEGRTIRAVNGVDFDIRVGEVLGLIGESGCGKSVTLRSLLHIHPIKTTRMSGSMLVGGQEVMNLGKTDLSHYRGSVASMVFQEPMLALDPVCTIGSQIAETVRRHSGMSRRQARERALEMLERVRIPSPRTRLDAYPHEMSGGMRQRAMIALALSTSPRLLLADEPTTALDATVQIQLLLLMRELQEELGMAAIFVTHDLSVAAEISDRVAVMYAGRIVEQGGASDVLKRPQHPYTQGLLASTVIGAMRGQRLDAIPGAPPDLAELPEGCAFAPRCKRRTPECEQAVPALVPGDDGRATACIHAGVGESVRAPGTSWATGLGNP